MSFSSLVNRLGQVERDVRRGGLDPGPEPEFRADLEFASNAELDALEAALVAEDTAEVARLAAVIEERRALGEAMASGRPARTWTPAVTPEFTKATREARAEGRSVLAVTDNLHVELGFLRGREPEPVALDLLPKLEEEARERQERLGKSHGTLSPETDEGVGRSDEKAAAVVGVGRPAVVEAEIDPAGVEIAARRAAEIADARQREAARAERLRHPRPEPSEAMGILEMEF